MTRPASSALVALAMTLLAILLLSHGVPSADDPYAPATAVAAGETSHCDHGPIRVAISGNATFLRLPKMLDTLEALPKDRPIELDLGGLRHLDHACRTALTTWAERHNEEGTEPVRILTTV
ncbi:hypothetical protein [Nonomuraea sp. NPDC003201]